MIIHEDDLPAVIGHAAIEVWTKQQRGTALPCIVVQGVIGKGELKLEVNEAGLSSGMGELAGPDEVACFPGGQPIWRRTLDEWLSRHPRRRFRGVATWEKFERLLFVIGSEAFDKVAEKIRSKLEPEINGGWLDRHDVRIGYDPESLLTDLIDKRQVFSATILAHPFLMDLAHSFKGAWQVLSWCDRLGSSPDLKCYEAVANNALQAVSRMVNSDVECSHSAGKRLKKGAIRLHRALLERSKAGAFPACFEHEPNAIATAALL